MAESDLKRLAADKEKGAILKMEVVGDGTTRKSGDKRCSLLNGALVHNQRHQSVALKLSHSTDDYFRAKKTFPQ